MHVAPFFVGKLIKINEKNKRFHKEEHKCRWGTYFFKKKTSQPQASPARATFDGICNIVSTKSVVSGHYDGVMQQALRFRLQREKVCAASAGDDM